MSFEGVFRGPKPKKQAGEARVTTSVGIRVSQYLEMKRRGLKPSDILETALTAALSDDDVTPEEAVAQMRAERDSKIEIVVAKVIEAERDDLESAYRKLQPDWNAYVAAGGSSGRSLAAKLAWIDGRKEGSSLASLDNLAILSGLEGT